MEGTVDAARYALCARAVSGRYGGALRYWAWRNRMVAGAWILTTGTPTDPLSRHVVVGRGTAEDIVRMLEELGAEPDRH